MPTFKFKAKKLGGEEIEGTREVEDRFTLAKSLKAEGYILVDFEEEGKKRSLGFLSYSIGYIKLSEKMIFTRNLAVMIGAGLPLSRALEVLTRQTKNKKFKKVLTNIRSEIIKGKSLSESMAKHKKIFPKFSIAMIKSGEKSGKMDESLNLVADQMEKEYAIKKKVRGAMVYPTIVITAMIGIGILMLVYVVPTLVSTYAELAIELPTSTKFIIWLSDSLITNSFLIFFIFLGLIICFLTLLRTEKFKKLVSTALLRLPLIAPLVQKVNSARTARTLSSLINSGVEILEALDVTTDIVQNFHYKNVLKKAKTDIKKGSTISSSFKKAEKIYPPLVGEMMAVGEETGKLPDMLLRLAVFYESEVSETTKNLSTVIEPILMIIIGVFVGFFAISMITPMYSMVDAF